MITVQDIHEKEFKRKMRGYDEVEVDEFLDIIAEDYAKLLQEVQNLREKAKAAPAVAPVAPVQAAPVTPIVQPKPVPAPAPETSDTVRSLETTLRDTLVIAQRTADETVAEAQKKAKLIIQGAEDRAALIQYDAEKKLEGIREKVAGARRQAADYRAQLRKVAEAQMALVDSLAVADDDAMQDNQA